MDLSSWTIETCVPIPPAPVEQPAAVGGAGSGGEPAGGAAGEGGDGGAGVPVCPPMPTFSQTPFNPPPQVKGNQCCYYQTMICG